MINTKRGISNCYLNLCKWQVEGADVEAVHGAVADHRLALISRHLWRRWVLHLLPLHRLVHLVVRNGRVTSRGLESIILLRSERDPTVADHWFQQVERVLDSIVDNSDWVKATVF